MTWEKRSKGNLSPRFQQGELSLLFLILHLLFTGDAQAAGDDCDVIFKPIFLWFAP